MDTDRADKREVIWIGICFFAAAVMFVVLLLIIWAAPKLIVSMHDARSWYPAEMAETPRGELFLRHVEGHDGADGRQRQQEHNVSQVL